MFEAEREFGEPHPKRFAMDISQSIFSVGAEAFSNVVLVLGEDADGPADGDKLQAELHLAAEPNVIADNAVIVRVGTTFPNLATKEE